MPSEPAGPAERSLPCAELLPRLSEVLAAIGTGVAYRVPDADVPFVLTPPAIGERVFGLVDAEYGWPVRVDLATVRRVADLCPGARRHPVLYDGDTCVAIALSTGEYARVRGRAGA